MALPILGPVLGALGSLLFRKVTETSPTGQTVTRRKATPMSKTLVYVLSAVALYHYFIYPVISYHWPHYNFPPLDASLFSLLLSIGSGGAQ